MRLVKKLSPISKEPNWLQCARNELGVKEAPGKLNNKRVVEYHQATSLKASADAVPWCASFVCWCLEVSGIKSTRSAAARSYLKYGKRIEAPKIGCIVILHRGEPSWQGHVGFVVGILKDSILVLGGNQSNKVCIQEYSKSKVLGYRWPIE